MVHIAPRKIIRKRGKRWNPDEHMRWLKKVYGDKIFPGSNAIWETARADRMLI